MNVSDPTFFFDQGNYALVRNHLTESLKKGQGLIVVTGPEGSGKKTLVEMTMSDFPYGMNLIKMDKLPDDTMGFFEFIAAELGLEPSTPITSTMEKLITVKYIHDALRKIHVEGGKCVLVIDRSHLMSRDILNVIRLLNDFEESTKKLIQIILLAEEKFMEKRDMPDREVLMERVETVETLDRISADSIRKYILHRIKAAGGQASVFTDRGWEALGSALSPGSTPHTINCLCDKALHAAFERKNSAVDAEDVLEAARGMDLQDNVDPEKPALEKPEREEQVESDREDDLKDEPVLSGRSDVPDKESEEMDKDRGRGQADTAELTLQVSEEAPSISEPDQKSFKDTFRTLLHRVLWNKEGTPPKKKEPDVSFGEMEAATADEFEVPANKAMRSMDTEEIAHPSEWEAVDTRGAKSFEPARGKDESLVSKNETAEKIDDWEHTGTKRTEELEIPEKKDIGSRKAEGIVLSSEWVIIDAKGAKSIKPGNVKNERPD